MAVSLLGVAAWGALSSSPVTPVKTRGAAPSEVANPRSMQARAVAVDGAFNLPFELTPTQTEAASFIIKDDNGDEKTWTFDSGFMKYGYHSRNQADDWFFVPVRLGANDNLLKLTFEMKAEGAYDECLEAGFGAAANGASMDIVVDLDNKRNTSWETHTALISTSGGEGTYYLGFHASSLADQYGMRVRRIKLESLSTPVPLAPVISSSTLDELNYTATITMPSSTLQGNAISGALGLKVDVDDNEVKNIPSCTPGAPVDVELTLTKGPHTITYTAYLTTDGTTMSSDPVSHQVRATSTAPAAVPFFMEPTQEEFENECVVLDANGDGKTWEYFSSENFIRYCYSSDNAADDWLFLPIIDFGEAGSFEISVEAKAKGNYDETFEICVGRQATPAAMTPKMSPEPVNFQSWRTLTGTFVLSEGGKWYVGIHCTSPKDLYELHLKNISITRSLDMTPKEPVIKSADFNGLSGSLTVTLPTETVDGNAITSQVGLVVNVDGVEYTRTEAADAGSDVTVPVNLTLGRHVISVAAYSGSGDKVLVGPAVLHEMVARNPEGYAYPLPFSMQPTKGEFETFTVVDANNDGVVWQYNDGAGVMMHRTAAEEDANDWVFLPFFMVEDVTRIYNVSLEARSYLERYPETFDVCIGREADPSKMTVISSQVDFTNYLYGTVSVPWTAPEAGKYLIGIHRKTPGTSHTLSIRNIKVEDSGKSVLAPGACEVVSVNPDINGALQAAVTFTMPVKAINGSDLVSSDVLTATLTASNGQSATTTGAPGSQHTLTVAAPEGHSTLALSVASSANGAGEPVEFPVYCGLDLPSIPVVKATVSEDNMSITVTWTDSQSGENGGAVNVPELAHVIYTPVDPSGFYWNKVVELPAETSSYTMEGSQLQDITFVGVTAKNSKGESQTGVGYAVTGAPYTLPITEDLRQGAYHYTPVMLDTPTEEYSTNWFLDRPGLIFPELAESEDNAMLCIEATAEGAAKYGRIMLPKFSTVDAHAPRATFRVYNSSKSAKAAVYAQTFGAEDVKVGEIPGSASAEGWNDYSFDLPASLVGRRWVNFYIEVEFTSYPQAFVLEKYNVRNVYAKQLSVALSAPTEVKVGETGDVKATVTNGSETAQSLPSVRCYLAGAGSEIALEPVSVPDGASVEPNAKAEYRYELRPDADMLGEWELVFELVDYTDEYNEDNSASRNLAVSAGDNIIVTDLTGSLSDDGSLHLSWTMPEMPETGNDDFEKYEPFTYAENIGNWLNIDGDGEILCGIGTEFPGSEMPRGFQVVNFPSIDVDLDLKAYSGDQYLMAICPSDETKAADDWLISPEVVPGSKVSFRFNIVGELYGTEQVDVLYSTTGRDVADFTLLQTFSQNRRGWNPLEVTLPEDAKYFAFHYRSRDIFGIALDDIFYSPANDPEFVGFDIFHNADVIATEHPENGFNVDSWKAGDKFRVQLVAKANGEKVRHPESNTFTVAFSGLEAVGSSAAITVDGRCVVITGMAGAAARIYAPDGRMVANRVGISDAERITLEPGVYVVYVDSVIAKVRID